MCPHCAIDLPPRRALPEFTAGVLAERARLAMLDPEGEHDAVRPLSGVRARQVLLHLTEPAGPHLIIGPVTRRDFGRELLDRLGAPADRDHGMLRCPAHEDRAASLSWRWTGERVLLRCFAGCTFDEIRAAL